MTDLELHDDFLPLARAAEKRPRPADPAQWSIAELRGGYQMMQPPAPQVEVGRIEEFSFPGPDSILRMRVYSPEGDGPFPVIMHMHGGGFVMGGLDTHDGTCRLMCQMTDCVVASVDYRLAPEHKIPAAFEDCYAALEWIVDNAVRFKGDPTRIALAGDSAGGNLSATLPILARDRGGPKVAFQLLMVPSVGTDMTTASFMERESVLLTRDTAVFFMNHMLDPSEAVDMGENKHVNWMLRPSDVEDLSGLPSAFVLVAEVDLLFDSQVNYVERLKTAGVDVELVIGKGMPHIFTSFAHVFPSARGYLQQGCDAMCRVLKG